MYISILLCTNICKHKAVEPAVMVSAHTLKTISGTDSLMFSVNILH